MWMAMEYTPIGTSPGHGIHGEPHFVWDVDGDGSYPAHMEFFGGASASLIDTIAIANVYYPIVPLTFPAGTYSTRRRGLFIE